MTASIASRIVTWIARHRALADALPSALLVAVGAADIAHDPRSTSFPGSPAVHLAFLVAAAAPFAVRRRWPAISACAGAVLACAWTATTYPVSAQGSFEAFVVLLAAAYTAANHLDGRRLHLVSAAILGLIAVGLVVAAAAGDDALSSLPVLLWWVAVWLVTRLLRRRQRQLAEQRRRADELAYEAGRVAAEAAIEERSRIARELHDVVAHSLSVMVVQAAAERRDFEAGRSDPASTAAVLQAVEDAGREALVELRGLLGLLRRPSDGPALAPQPGLGDLDRLVAETRDAGLDVAVVRDSDLGGLPAGIDLAAYRVVQEALTNVVKHAGATRCEVRVSRRGRSVEIVVTDDGRGVAGSWPAGGHGVLGMRERATMYGGTLDAGPMPGGGYRVRACLPLDGVPAVTA